MRSAISLRPRITETAAHSSRQTGLAFLRGTFRRWFRYRLQFSERDPIDFKIHRDRGKQGGYRRAGEQHLEEECSRLGTSAARDGAQVPDRRSRRDDIRRTDQQEPSVCIYASDVSNHVRIDDSLDFLKKRRGVKTASSVRAALNQRLRSSESSSTVVKRSRRRAS